MINLAVIFGGCSVEHEISIITALQAIESLDKEKYMIFPIYISKENNWYSDISLLKIDTFKDLSNIKKLKEVSLIRDNGVVVIKNNNSSLFSFNKNSIITTVDFVMPIVHGTNVEDGALQGYIKTLDIPFFGPTVTSGVIGQDKAIMKDILKANNIPQIDYKWYFNNVEFEDIHKDIISTINLPVIVKPALLGSSVGIGIARTMEELEIATNNAFSYCDKIVIEKFISDFREMNISVVGNFKESKLSVVEEVSKSDDILSYEDKYTSNAKGKSEGMASLDRIIPAKISNVLSKKIDKIARDTFVCLNAQGVVRIDMIIINDDVFINEINNIPGSLSFYLWEKTNVDYTKLLDQVIEIGVDSYFNQKNIMQSFDTNVLSLQGKGAKK